MKYGQCNEHSENEVIFAPEPPSTKHNTIIVNHKPPPKITSRYLRLSLSEHLPIKYSNQLNKASTNRNQ